MLAINPSLQYQENITTTNASNLTNAGDYASLAQVFLEHVKPKHINKLIGWQFNKVLRESAINRDNWWILSEVHYSNSNMNIQKYQIIFTSMGLTEHSNKFLVTFNVFDAHYLIPRDMLG